ncbi:hypothetical protein [Brevibacillus marinus]|uniref:hypothetical protein n=1 Tax=Brevibacillus marinus TaxID=2496837 RepID=UPI0013E01060|nr:hypothetical protein [Brevibacillus marinus]
MGLLYDAVMKMKDKKRGEAAAGRSTAPSFAKRGTQRVVRPAKGRTTPLNLPSWLLK